MVQDPFPDVNVTTAVGDDLLGRLVAGLEVDAAVAPAGKVTALQRLAVVLLLGPGGDARHKQHGQSAGQPHLDRSTYLAWNMEHEEGPSMNDVRTNWGSCVDSLL